jgi:hypothetical protein
MKPTNESSPPEELASGEQSPNDLTRRQLHQLAQGTAAWFVSACVSASEMPPNCFGYGCGPYGQGVYGEPPPNY